jgi:hypothetical protein
MRWSIWRRVRSEVERLLAAIGVLPESIGNGMVGVCAIRVLEVTLEMRLEFKHD